MQDRDIPPEAEGRTNGAEDGVRLNEVPEALEARWAETVNRGRASTRLPWITTTAPTWAVTMAAAGAGAAPVSARPILHWSPILCRPNIAMPLPASLPSLRICFFSPRFRKLGAR